MKICPVGAEFHANGQTDRQTDRHDKTNSRFSQLCELAKNEHSFYISLHDFSSLETFFLLVCWKTSYAGSTTLYDTTQAYVKMVYEFLIFKCVIAVGIEALFFTD